MAQRRPAGPALPAARGAAPDGRAEPALLGADLAGGQQPQALIPGGTWQCAAPAGQQPVLVSCVVAPGFDFDDFRLRPMMPPMIVTVFPGVFT